MDIEAVSSGSLLTTASLNTTEESTVSPNSTNSTGLIDDEIIYPDALLDAAAACFAIFAVVGVTGNFISILALSRCPRLRNATTAFIINLCVADLIFGVLSSPLQAVTYAKRDWIFGDGLLCKLFPFVSYVNALVSLFTVLAIAINRYICVVHPLRYASIYKARNVGIMIAVLWTCCFCIMFLPLFSVWGKLGYNLKGRTCDIVPVDGKTPKDILFGIALGLPSVVFIFCYSRIVWVVRKATHKVRSGDPATRRSDIPSIIQVRPAPSKLHFWVYLKNRKKVEEAPNIPRERKELKVMKVVLIIFVTYVLCYVPVSLVKILSIEKEAPFLNILGYVLVFMVNCINPVIYVATSDEYRKAYAQLFSCNKSPVTM